MNRIYLYLKWTTLYFGIVLNKQKSFHVLSISNLLIKDVVLELAFAQSIKCIPSHIFPIVTMLISPIWHIFEFQQNLHTWFHTVHFIGHKMYYLHIAGSLGTSVFDVDAFLVGASGGVYALLAAHLANILLVSFTSTYSL